MICAGIILVVGLIVAARRSVAQLFALVPCVDEVVELEWKGGASDWRAMMRDVRRLRAIRRRRGVAAAQLFASAWLARPRGVPQRWGYARDGRSLLLTRAIAVEPTSGRLSTKAAITSISSTRWAHPTDRSSRASSFPRLPSAMRERSCGRPAGTATVRWSSFAPGAAYGTAKRWWPTHFAQLASDLVGTQGAHIVLIGSAADGVTTTEVRGMVPDDARAAVSDVAGRTSLEVLAAILSLARACVSNDSGAMHVAAAVGVPLTALFGPTNEHETAPLAHAPMELLIHQVSCRPCMLRECPIDHPCMRDLEPARVLASVSRMLSSRERAS